MPNNPFNPIAAKTRLRVNGTLGQERRLMQAVHHSSSRVALIVEAIVCFAPTLAYLLTGIIFLPHQLILAAGHGVTESWFPVMYYVGAACLILGVWRLFGELGAKSSPTFQPRTTLALLAVGAFALVLGPAATFALSKYQHIGGWFFVVFVLLPLSGVVHLIVASRDWLFGGPTSRSTRSRAKTRAPG
jgi:hypothetical protein